MFVEFGCYTARNGGICSSRRTENDFSRDSRGKSHKRTDEKFIARHEVCGDIGDFCAAAARILRFGGRFYVVWRPDRLVDLISAMREHGLEPKKMTFVHADEQSEPSMVLIEARHGGSGGMVVTAPLMLHSVESRGEKSRALSEAAERIYKTMLFEG